MTTQNTSSTTVKKIASIAFFLVLFYVLPLIGNPGLLIQPRVIFLAVICTILFATQPRISIKESKVNSATDNHTVWLIIIISGIGQIASLIEWAYFSNKAFTNTVTIPGSGIFGTDWQFDINIAGNLKTALTYCGAFLLVTGTLFRLYAIKTLGKYFSAIVQIKKDHKIIQAGPYSFLRHPSYTGAYMAMVGCSLFLQSYVGFVLLAIVMLFVYKERIMFEEKTLSRQFGIGYWTYSLHTWKMFPYFW